MLFKDLVRLFEDFAEAARQGAGGWQNFCLGPAALLV